MKSILLILLLAITPLSAAYSLEEYEYYSESLLTFNPTICILESDVEDFSKYEFIAIQSMTYWVTSLQTYTQNYDSWNIYYLVIPFEERENTIPSDCYVLLIFYEEISNDTFRGKTKTLETGHELIEIYNNDISSEQLVSTVSHEIGHIFGLGHYITDDKELKKQWIHATNNPSIMTKTAASYGIQKITEMDLEMIVSIYGNNGFDKLPPMIPDWIQNIYKWNNEGLVEDLELNNAIDYLVQNGIIQIV